MSDLRSAGAEPVFRVDSHAHVMRRDLPLIPDHRHAPERDALLPEFLGLLDAKGVTHAVLTAPSFYGTDNSFLLEALRSEPERLRGTVIVDPGIETEALEKMARLGVVGIRLNMFRRPRLPDLRSPQWKALLGRIGALGWHVEIYVESNRLPDLLEPLLDSGVKVVIDHFGSPDPQLGLACPGIRRLLGALGSGRVWVKLSAPYRVGLDKASSYADALLSAAGSGRLVWGSDWPWTQNDAGMSYDKALRWLDTWVPGQEDRAAIFGTTPLSLFGFRPAPR